MTLRPLVIVLTFVLFQLSVFGQVWNPIERDLTNRLLVLQTRIKPLYRKPTRDELKAVEPSRMIAARYAEFLKQPNTGLTKLINDKNCGENMKVVSASEDCLKYTMPGGGSSFSFREETYRLPRLADVLFTENSFQASGAILHGIFVKLGDIPLGEVTLQTPGVNFLAAFRPEPDYDRAREIDNRLSRGIESGGFLYRRGLYAVDDTTYGLRSIAYGGKNYRAASGVTYNELDFDKREDVIVVFRIVERDDQGNVTILWKKLQEKNSPKVNWKTGDAPKM